MAQVLYRKYRPTTLSEVVGQPSITTALENSLKSDKIAHAYLFIGPRGTGKTSVARIFAHAVNGFDYQVEDSYLDIIEIDAASNTGVDNIRELREKAMIAPTKGKYKVYIIDEVHMLSKSASNALLKTLEEPPKHVIFIMATTDAHKVPITISSRTQVHTFQLANAETMANHLRKIADAEKIPIDDSAIQLIVKRGGGSFRDSLSLLDQIASLSDDLITAEVLEKALGLPQTEAIQGLLSAFQAQDSAALHQTLQSLLNTGIRPEVIVSDLIENIIKNPSPALLPLLEKLPAVAPPFPEAKLLLALLQNSPQATTFVPTSNIPKPSTTPKAPKSPLSPVEPPKSPEKPKPSLDPTPVEKPLKTASTPAKPEKALKPADFDWNTLLDQLHASHTALYNQLSKTDHELKDGTLHLYPTQKFTKTILERPANRDILAQLLPGLPLNIHDPGAKTPPKDSPLGQISAIMGNIQEVNGDQPF